jgi:hypothetical protein
LESLWPTEQGEKQGSTLPNADLLILKLRPQSWACTLSGFVIRCKVYSNWFLLKYWLKSAIDENIARTRITPCFENSWLYDTRSCIQKYRLRFIWCLIPTISLSLSLDSA